MSRVSHYGTELVQPTGRPETKPPEQSDSEYLRLLGENVRAARARRGMTRKMLATDSSVSERFLAQLESGTGNASVLILRQISQALNLSLEAMLPGAHEHSVEMERALSLLQRLEPLELREAQELLFQRFGKKRSENDRRHRIALIGLRGAGKSTIGKLLSRKLELPFFELDGLIEQTSGISLSMIFDLYGQSGFRRFERRCLDNLLSTSCYTIWLRATPQDHMSRVIAQGDIRPMAQSAEAMSDLERILAERDELYRRADASIDTNGKSVEEVIQECFHNLESMLDVARK